MALPLSWLNLFFPTIFLVTTTIGAKTPLPSFTFFIIGFDRIGLANLTRVGTDFINKLWSSPCTDEPQLPLKDEYKVAETEVVAIQEEQN